MKIGLAYRTKHPVTNLQTSTKNYGSHRNAALHGERAHSGFASPFTNASLHRESAAGLVGGAPAELFSFPNGPWRAYTCARASPAVPSTLLKVLS